ncbi:MAG: FlgD immunoglobulin-like domain containing protein, partial [Bacteroidota bacterium]|nr:FlgD immunoglobulin-like domain containing protein [Bacteroidota bacterium]
VRIKDAAGLAITLGGNANAPKSFGLSQNYPNPFNPITWFTVDAPKVSTVEVVVYDVLGRKVKTLMNGEIAIGSYPLEWDGTDGQSFAVPTGIYFIRVTADEFSAVQKIMLMK